MLMTIQNVGKLENLGGAIAMTTETAADLSTARDMDENSCDDVICGRSLSKH